MPYDIYGNFTLPPGYKVANGQKVLPSQHNPPLEDIKGALSSVLVIDGRKPMAGPLPMGGNKITGLADGVDPQDAATVGQAAAAIGDGKWSARELDETWLRRDGSIYAIANYPDLAALFTPLPDGLSLSQVHSGAGAIRDILYGNSKYVAINAAGGVSFSTDRASWTTVSSGVPALGRGVYGAGIFLAATGTQSIAKSLDGETWSSQSVLPSGVNSVDVGWDGTYLYVIGNKSSSPLALTVMRSTDGNTWSDVSPSPSKDQIARWIVGRASAVLVDTNAASHLSTNQGGAWTENTSSFPASGDCVWTGSKYLSVGTAGAVRDSTAGTTWTNRTSGTSETLTCVGYSSAAALAGGENGVIRLSVNDGVNWTGVSTGTSAGIRAILPVPGSPEKFLIGTENGLIFEGLKTDATQFRVPDDGPNEWVKALAA